LGPLGDALHKFDHVPVVRDSFTEMVLISHCSIQACGVARCLPPMGFAAAKSCPWMP
jgi:hypothetical protein